MKAVYSFTSKPFASSNNTRTTGGFLDLESFYCAWILTTTLAKRNFSSVELITDTPGWELLKPLNLPIDDVKIKLDNLPYHSELWAMGKIHAYQMQENPFVHIDYDAFIWEPLTARFTNSDIICQNIEDAPYYDNILQTFLQMNTYCPDFVQSFIREHQYRIFALNMGVFGGYNIDAIQHYCDEAIKTVTTPLNQDMWLDLADNHGYKNGLLNDFNILIEQYFAGTFTNQKKLRYECVMDPADPIKYTHLISESKRKLDNCALLKLRVAHELPDQYEIVQGML